MSQDVLDEIKQVYSSIIRTYLQESPLKKSVWLSDLTGGEIWLKLESLNPNGSFKVRGALNAVSKIKKSHTDQSEKIKICAASAGNHAQGVAFAAKQLGCEAHIFLPRFAPLVKIAATEKLGAKTYFAGDSLEDAFVAAQNFATKEKAHFLHAFNNYDIIIGQASCAYEALMQLSAIQKTDLAQPDYFVCGVGGGGLAAGAALALKALGKTRVIGIEQEAYDSALKSLHDKRIQPASKPSPTIADGIAVGQIGSLNYDYMSKYIEEIATVSDDWIVKAILGMCEQEHLVSEGAGSVGVADVLRRPEYYSGKTAIVCVSGGNIDPQLLNRILTRGLNMTGRVLRVTACISDRPGGLKKLLQYVADMGGNVLDLIHDRTYSEVSIGDVDVEISIETRDSGHQYLLIEKLEEAGFKPRMRH